MEVFIEYLNGDKFIYSDIVQVMDLIDCLSLLTMEGMTIYVSKKSVKLFTVDF